jgi:hypothetical protein
MFIVVQFVHLILIFGINEMQTLQIVRKEKLIGVSKLERTKKKYIERKFCCDVDDGWEVFNILICVFVPDTYPGVCPE